VNALPVFNIFWLMIDVNGRFNKYFFMKKIVDASSALYSADVKCRFVESAFFFYLSYRIDVLELPVRR